MAALFGRLQGLFPPASSAPNPAQLVQNAPKVPLHPFYPLELVIEGYAENEWGTLKLLTLFSAGCAVIFLFTYLLLKRIRPNFGAAELSTILWFVLCGCIHSFFEGYFAYNFRRMATMQDLFGQLWKEYSLSDSRYQTQNAFVLCMESITAIAWGPLSFIVAWTIATNHPLRYPLQAVVSLGQIYGDVLYYATSMFDYYILNLEYSRPEPFYFWCYFVLMNAFWIVIPAVLLFNSITASSKAFAALEKVEKTLKANRMNGAINGKANGSTKKGQ